MMVKLRCHSYRPHPHLPRLLVGSIDRPQPLQLFCYRRFSLGTNEQIRHDEIKLQKVRIKGTTVTAHSEDPPSSFTQYGKEVADKVPNKGSGSSAIPGYQAVQATKLGAAANLGLAISKGTMGFAIASTALIADAANSLGDLLSDAVVYYSVTEARKKATPDRPWGRGKAEPLGALSVGSLLLATAAGIGVAGLASAITIAASSQLIPQHYADVLLSGDILNHIIQQVYSSGGDSNNTAVVGNAVASMENALDSQTTLSAATDSSAIAVNSTAAVVAPALDTSSHQFSLSANEFAALGVSGMSIFAKEALFRYTLKAGTEANSDAVIANAWQHRSDVSISSAVFVGLIGGMMGYPILDPLAGVLVAGIIGREGFKTIIRSLKDLGDVPASATETDMLKQTCLSVSGVIAVEELKARKSGPYLYVEVTVGVDGNISASAAHRLGELTRQELLKRHIDRVANVVVDVTPLGSSGLGEQSPHWARDHDFIVDEIKNAAKKVEEVISVSEVQVYYKDNGEIATKLDIVLHRDWTIQQAHWIAVKARRQIERALPGLTDIDVDLELEEETDSSDSDSDSDSEKDGEGGKKDTHAGNNYNGVNKDSSFSSSNVSDSSSGTEKINDAALNKRLDR